MLRVIFFLSAILFGFWGTLTYADTSVNTSSHSDIAPSPFLTPSTDTQFVLEAPAQSLQGTITKLSGIVKADKRDNPDEVTLVQGDSVGDGESIFTSEDSEVTIAFGEERVISLDEQSFVSFPGTIPSNFLVSQYQGTVLYSSTLLWVRIAGTLLEIEGEVLVSYAPDEGVIVLETREGTVKLGWVNDQKSVSTEKIPPDTTAVFSFEDDAVIIKR